MKTARLSLQWRHNGGFDGVSNHQPYYCLLNRLWRCRSKLRVTGHCARNSPVTGEFTAQMLITRKMFPFNDVSMECQDCLLHGTCRWFNAHLYILRNPHKKNFEIILWLTALFRPTGDITNLFRNMLGNILNINYIKDISVKYKVLNLFDDFTICVDYCFKCIRMHNFGHCVYFNGWLTMSRE